MHMHQRMQIMFFTKSNERKNRRFCKKIARTKKIKGVKHLMTESELESEHICCYVWAPREEVEAAGKTLKWHGDRIKRITGIDDVLVAVMGHPHLTYRTVTEPSPAS